MLPKYSGLELIEFERRPHADASAVAAQFSLVCARPVRPEALFRALSTLFRATD
jgi:hypothetical protein